MRKTPIILAILGGVTLLVLTGATVANAALNRVQYAIKRFDWGRFVWQSMTWQPNMVLSVTNSSPVGVKFGLHGGLYYGDLKLSDVLVNPANYAPNTEVEVAINLKVSASALPVDMLTFVNEVRDNPASVFQRLTIRGYANIGDTEIPVTLPIQLA